MMLGERITEQDLPLINNMERMLAKQNYLGIGDKTCLNIILDNVPNSQPCGNDIVVVVMVMMMVMGDLVYWVDLGLVILIDSGW